MKIDDVILEVFNGIFHDNYDSLDISRDQLREWDSMKHAEIIIKIQKKLNIRLKAQDIGKIRNLRDLKEIIIHSYPSLAN